MYRTGNAPFERISPFDVLGHDLGFQKKNYGERNPVCMLTASVAQAIAK